MLGGHPEHDLAAGGVGRDVGVAAFRAEVAAREFQPLVVAGLLDRDRAFDGDVLVGRPFVLRAPAEPARRAMAAAFWVPSPVITFAVPPGS